MIIDFQVPTDGEFHRYCIKCKSERVTYLAAEYYCHECELEYDRGIVLDPSLIWWVDRITKQYSHESCGAIVINDDNKILLLMRKIYPTAYCFPAGHLDTAESAEQCLRRELHEETGILAGAVNLIGKDVIVGDGCSRGADVHVWNTYSVRVPNNIKVKLNYESEDPEWLSLDEIRTRDLVFPARFLVDRYGEELLK